MKGRYQYTNTVGELIEQLQRWPLNTRIRHEIIEPGQQINEYLVRCDPPNRDQLAYIKTSNRPLTTYIVIGSRKQ